MSLELQAIAIHYIPPAPKVENPLPKGGNIDFNSFIWPFTQLITMTGMVFFSAMRPIVQYSRRVLVATQVVFYRLINPPSFDPAAPSFKKLLDQFESEVPNLQERIDQLEQRFWQNHLLFRDVRELKNLNNEISQSLRQLNYYAGVLGRRRDRFPIQDQLDQVKDTFQHLDDQMDAYCIEEGKSILGEFQKVIDLFTKGSIGLPKEMRQTLIQAGKDLDSILKKRIFSQADTSEGKAIRFSMTALRDQVKILEKQSSEEMHSISYAKPLKLKNIGNSCYLDSVLQALLCIDQIRDQIGQPIARDPKKSLTDYQKKLAIQQELLQFIQTQPKHQGEQEAMTEMEFILFLFSGPSLYRLRDAIFKSEFHHEFQVNLLTEQLDAASAAELLTDEFLPNCKFKSQAFATTPVFPGIEFKRAIDTLSVLQIPLRTQARYHKLDRLIHTTLGLHLEREKDPAYQRTFDPKDGEVIKGKEEEADKVMLAAPTKVDEFHEKYKFTQLPPVLVIQFKRFLNYQVAPGKPARLVKDTRPVILPQDGILDLSQYCDLAEGESKARYRIKSMVRHCGGLHGGHYVAETEINGKYYHCDDIDPRGYNEVTKKDFYSHKDPYLLVLERISEDKIELPVKKKK